MRHATELTALVLGERWLREALSLVREFGPPDAYVAAGSIRNLVWNRETARRTDSPSEDLDIVYFDPAESMDCSARYQTRLVERGPGLDWEVVNQAFVHTWLGEYSSRPAPPFKDLDAALRAWPETATAVAVKLVGEESLDILAPFGLDDLFDLVVRPNPDCASAGAYSCRVASKAWASRWPELTILPPIAAR